LRRDLAVLLALAALLVVLAIKAPPFFAAANLRDILLANVPVLVASIGMTLVILLGEIDISIGSQFAVCTVAAGVIAKAGVSMIVVALFTALIGCVMGAINAGLVAKLGIPSIVVTLATMAIWRDGLRWLTGGAWIQNLPADFQWLGLSQAAGEFTIMLLAALLFAIFGWALRNLAAGRAVYATGSDAEAARLSGIPTRGVRFAVFVFMGGLTGVAALLNSIRFSEVQSSAGIGLEVKTIAAVVVGGAAISGGRGTLLGSLLGVALLGAVGPALTFLGINAYWEKAIHGGIILIAVLADAAAGKIREQAFAR
jgi:ribose/xylose/arabinose/galactoside ABC-type transport system permease subunit